MKSSKLGNLVSFLIFILPVVLSCGGPQEVRLNVHRLKLDNGLTVLLVKREGAPVFSATIRIKVGNIEEPKGATGLAHFFEHMAFKGTHLIGTRDYDSETILLKKIDDLGERIVTARAEGAKAATIATIEGELKRLEKEQARVLDPNEFVRIYQRNGGGDLNATTSNDFTNYFVSLPVNKLELWAYLESERLKNLVMREFYKERDVVVEERRMRYDNNPDGKLYETFMKEAFDISPYRNNVIGWPEDIQNLTPIEARAFFEKYYTPSRMVVGIVGNFDLQEAESIVRRHFGKLEKKEGEDSPPDENVPEPGPFPREHVLTGPYEPRSYLGFHRPAHPHPDDEIFDVIEVLLCEGRTSRLYSLLVDQKKMAAAVDCYASLPGSRLNGLFSFYAIPLNGYTNHDVRDEIILALERMKKEKVGEEEIKKVENRIDADLIWAMKTNKGLASWITYFESLAGDWEYLYRMQKRIHEITPEDVQRVVSTYFVPELRVQVFLEKEEEP